MARGINLGGSTSTAANFEVHFPKLQFGQQSGQQCCGFMCKTETRTDRQTDTDSDTARLVWRQFAGRRAEKVEAAATVWAATAVLPPQRKQIKNAEEAAQKRGSAQPAPPKLYTRKRAAARKQT